MSAIACPPKDQLKDFYLGLGSEEQTEEMLAHICNCASCQANLDTLPEDSLVEHLRTTDQDSAFEHEAACQLGIAKALAALSVVPVDGSATERDAVERIGQEVGDYEVLRAIGSGGMGRVYLARHTKLGRLVALKILAGHRLGDHRAAQRFQAEMRAVGALSHPNIVNALDARDIDGQAVLVTEYIDGVDLGQLVNQLGPLPVADACQIICHIAAALQYTAEQGFVHRDVKPSNIMLSRQGEVKLLDLGLARIQYGDTDVPDVTCTGQTLGTADYISPEQVTDSRQVDVRSDIYSLGATFYKLLIGSAPFADARFPNAFAKMTAHVSQKPAPLRGQRPEVPAAVERLVLAMLSKRAEDRPQTAADIVKELTRHCESSDLQQLISRAPTKGSSSDTSSSTSPALLSRAALAPATAGNDKRGWDRYKLIAAGFFGAVVGFCLGVVITITHANGSKTVVTVPAGTKVEIAESPAPATKSTPAMDATTQHPGTTSPAPRGLLEFALFVHRESNGPEPSIKADELDKMLEALHSNSSDVTVSTEHFKFVRIATSMAGDVPISAWNNGIRYALISLDPTYSIGWEDIEGRINRHQAQHDAQKNEGTISLTFDETLGQKLKALSERAIGQRLGIVIDNCLVQAPVLNTALGSKIQITGTFSSEQAQAIQKASLLNVPATDSFKAVGDFELIELQSIDAALAYRILSHRFAKHSKLRLQVDERSNSIMVRAEPGLLKEILELIELLDRQKETLDGRQIRVIMLSIDPQLAVTTVEKFFDLKKGDEHNKDAPIVHPDATGHLLIVQAKPEQFEIIRDLLAKIGNADK